MDLLFVGLIALGVAMAVVIFLKCICFLGEFINSQRELRHGAQTANTSTSAASPASPETGHSGNGPATRTGSNYSVRRLTDRVYMIYIEQNLKPSNLATAQSSIPYEAPPTYEEALRLIDTHPITHSNTNENSQSNSLQ